MYVVTVDVLTSTLTSEGSGTADNGTTGTTGGTGKPAITAGRHNLRRQDIGRYNLRRHDIGRHDIGRNNGGFRRNGSAEGIVSTISASPAALNTFARYSNNPFGITLSAQDKKELSEALGSVSASTAAVIGGFFGLD